MNIPFVDLAEQQRRIRADLDRRIAKVLDHGGYILGPEVTELEGALAAIAGCRHAITVSSGTDALLMLLMAKGIGPGDGVFLPSFTFTATAEVVLQCGASPIFVEVDAQTFNMDPECLADAIAETERQGQLRAAAVMPVDLFGQPADYQAINKLAGAHGLFVLGDAAQSFGASYQNRAVGSVAEATATSFYPAKPLGCYGDGGAIFTDDDELAATCISLRAHGQGEGRYDIVRLGLNARMDTLQAAVLLSKLTIFEDEIQRRREVAEHYNKCLTGLVETPVQLPGTASIWAQYTIKLPHRDKIAAHLREQGIPTQIYYPLPMHLQPAYAPYGNGVGSLPVSEQLCHEVLALPMHPYLDEGTIERIRDALAEGLRMGQSR
ncbi:MAG: DegT/DnrJ/EryC1/StrS family aminotransferase [Rhodospirillaceae bacterium]|jgi:dTDP-4-amino-4,6-dideoxygalactose transaminase|nr:DegT/DnrJ/EryC1/StrS family aminotransferase [Rhodospirillaceae bacterium]MBT4044837.1 DegT/DnrJ/EryC1/StrS family aminotransferase [Rhodospirillaceae bacterium]MBT4690946.1 DegT/DnrJ/EryC1/StrS family aminotransferase [Rhodospirillaceae bacterium]MBT5081473.1 DegT/DnrJ/EryC1/StrS family aminotransferase [Rhodospirillaceae bacterium]MBT5526915.1 DegT/DnrJ/EryC1/StrS family aminotransferase [Rhodospirillaceae bacterium]